MKAGLRVPPRAHVITAGCESPLPRCPIDGMSACGYQQWRGRRELLYFGGVMHGRCGRLAAAHRHGDKIKVPGADLMLMARGSVAVRFAGELFLLELRIGHHAVTFVRVCQLEHAVIERMEAGQCDELEPIAHLRKSLLECCDRGRIELSRPV